MCKQSLGFANALESRVPAALGRPYGAYAAGRALPARKSLQRHSIFEVFAIRETYEYPYFAAIF